MEKDFIEQLELIGITARIRRLNDVFTSSGRKVYKQMGIDIEPNWHLIFLLLEEKEKLSITEIARTLKFSHPAVIKISKKMLEKGYLQSSKDETDHRKQILSLSKKAIDSLPELKEKWALIQKVHDEYISDDFLKELALLEQSLSDKSIDQRINERLE